MGIPPYTSGWGTHGTIKKIRKYILQTLEDDYGIILNAQIQRM